MKYLFSFIFVIIISNFSFSQPKIEIVGGKEFNFNDMYVGTKAEKKITIKNIGKDTLVINNVQASCGCTATLLSDKIIPPKKTATLNIGFDSKGFYGKVQKTVTIYSNDSLNTPLTINFTANVISLLQFDPQYIYFQQMKPDSTASINILVKNNSSEPIEIVSIQNKVTGLKIDVLQRKLMPNETTQLKATFTAISEGIMQGDVVFNLKNNKQPAVPIRFFAYVKK